MDIFSLDAEINKLILLQQEGEYWDFKKEWHINKADLLHDIIAALQSYITENFYTCSKEILESLGQMYMQDERFWQNIDRAGGKGTAEFVSRAITVYCKA